MTNTPNPNEPGPDEPEWEIEFVEDEPNEPLKELTQLGQEIEGGYDVGVSTEQDTLRLALLVLSTISENTALRDLVENLDDDLITLEDTTHGNIGMMITKMRVKISEWRENE